MSVLWKVTWRSLKENQIRTVVTVIGILLSAAMICGVTSFAASIRNYMVQITVYSSGDWHVGSLDTDADTLQQLRGDDRVASMVYARQLGYAWAEGDKIGLSPICFCWKPMAAF